MHLRSLSVLATTMILAAGWLRLSAARAGWNDWALEYSHYYRGLFDALPAPGLAWIEPVGLHPSSWGLVIAALVEAGAIYFDLIVLNAAPSLAALLVARCGSICPTMEGGRSGLCHGAGIDGSSGPAELHSSAQPCGSELSVDCPAPRSRCRLHEPAHSSEGRALRCYRSRCDSYPTACGSGGARIGGTLSTTRCKEHGCGTLEFSRLVGSSGADAGSNPAIGTRCNQAGAESHRGGRCGCRGMGIQPRLALSSGAVAGRSRKVRCSMSSARRATPI
jgi:hypothetical protein